MFRSLGPALVLLRMLREKTQAAVARESGLGTSQLSKYESGHDLPRLETLERLLRALGVGHLEFACTLALVDNRAKRLKSEGPADGLDERAWLLVGRGLVSPPLEELFSRMVTDLMKLQQSLLEQILFGAARGRGAGPGDPAPDQPRSMRS